MASFFPPNATLDDKIQYGLVGLLRLSLVLAVAVAFFLGQWEVIFFGAVALLLSFIPRLIERNYKVELPIEFEAVIVLFVYAAIFLGEAEDFYYRFWWWDLMLHIVSGIVLGFTAFLALYILYIQKRLRAKPFVVSLFAFSFSLAIGALWEIGEFTLDQLFGLNTQKSGLKDTMSDLIVDAGGAFIAAGLGYLFLKRQQVKRGLLSHLIDNFFNNNPHLKGKFSGKR